MADTLLRATGGYTAMLLIPAAQGDTTDAGQLGINAPNLQQLTLAPVVFRRTRPTMEENQSTRYELLVSASAVVEQVSLLQLDSADALFSLVAGVTVLGLNLLVESWGASALTGEALLYRLLLRVAEPQSLISLSNGG